MNRHINEIAEGTHHIWELQGLGKAPFRCVGIDEKTSQACPGAPIQPGGTCDHCGRGIRYVCRIRGSDGAEFSVGTTCVEKTGDNGLRQVVSAWKAEHQDDLAEKRRERAKAKALELLEDEDLIEWLASKEHPVCATYGTALDYVMFCKTMPGTENWVRYVIREAAALKAAKE